MIRGCQGLETENCQVIYRVLLPERRMRNDSRERRNE